LNIFFIKFFKAKGAVFTAPVFIYYGSSTAKATASPPPIHKVAIPRFKPRAFSA
jgi:hypothetical protein